MAAAVQALLRFLVHDARLPLPAAMSSVAALRNADLTAPSALATAKLDTLKDAFGGDEKLAKQVVAAAKRVAKTKRSAEDAGVAGDEGARKKRVSPARDPTMPLTPVMQERALALPAYETDVEILRNTTLVSNRAPLVLAFAVVLLQYTMPRQPLSSRLSLAQTLVSLNSRSRAVTLGLESGKSAEEEGFGEGQPLVRVMGRQVRVLKRWGYDATDNGGEDESQEAPTQDPSEESVPVWGLDLEALKGKKELGGAALPIHTPQSARAYLLKSFARKEGDAGGAKGTSGKAAAVLKEENVGRLLGTIDLLVSSWAKVLSVDDLDARAWSWYVRVRPEVAQGVQGWGGKGEIRLSEILALRRVRDEDDTCV